MQYRYCIYSVFRHTGVTHCSDKREISPVPNFPFLGTEMWEYSLKTVKISNFGHKFAPRRRLVCTVFTKFPCVCTRLGSF